MPDPSEIPVRDFREGSTSVSSTIRHPIQHPSYNILVPIPGDAAIRYDQLQLSRLLRTPLAVAEDRGGAITIANILVAPDDIPAGDLEADSDGTGILDSVLRDAQEDLVTVLERAIELAGDVPVHGFVGVVDLPKSALSEFTTGEHYDGLCLAQNSTGSVRLWDEPVISDILGSAQCAVYIENIGAESELIVETPDGEATRDAHVDPRNVSDILLAVGTGPHTVLGAETARALATASGASVAALHLFTSSDRASRQDGEEALTLAEYVLSDVPNVEFEARSVAGITDALLAEIDQYDVAILGAPTKQPLVSRLFARSTTDELVSQSDTSVITVRQPPDAMDSVYYRWKRAIERTADQPASTDEVRET